jgi:hypothetical protein
MAWDSQAPKRLLTGEKGSTSLKPKQPDGSIEKQHLSRLVSRNKKASIPPRLASFMNGSFSSAQLTPSVSHPKARGVLSK